MIRRRTRRSRRPFSASAPSSGRNQSRPLESPKEAVIISLNEKGRVDLEHMASLLSRPAEEFLPELKGVLFLNPQSREWETEDHYLSGDVREKLQTAEAASLTEPRFHENVEALKSVQPENLSATEIDARLGACWIPVKDMEAFAQELLGAEDVTIRFHAATRHLDGAGRYMAKGSVANTTDWGTNRATALELVEDALNLRTPTIYDKVRDGNKDKQVVNPNSTEARARKAAENQRPVPGMDLAERRAARTARQKIQRGIQLRPAADFQRRTPDACRAQATPSNCICTRNRASGASCKRRTRCSATLSARAKPSRWLRRAWS